MSQSGFSRFRMEVLHFSFRAWIHHRIGGSRGIYPNGWGR